MTEIMITSSAMLYLASCFRDTILQGLSDFFPNDSFPLKTAAAPARSGAAPRSSRLASHPLATLTGSTQLPPSMEEHDVRSQADGLGEMDDGVQAIVSNLEAQLAACTSELASTCTELALAKDDLDRDEIIFASKLQEVSALQAHMEETAAAAAEQRGQQEAAIAQLRQELEVVRQLATDDSLLLGQQGAQPPSARCTEGLVSNPPPAAFWEACRRSEGAHKLFNTLTASFALLSLI